MARAGHVSSVSLWPRPIFRGTPLTGRELARRHRARARSGGCGSDSPSATGLRDRYSWAALLQRVFSVGVLKCADCGSRRRWVAAITRGKMSIRILEHLGLESRAPSPAPAHAPRNSVSVGRVPEGETVVLGEHGGWGNTVSEGRPC